MFLLFLSAAAFVAWRSYKGSYAQNRVDRFFRLVDSFRAEEYSYPASLYKASSIVARSSYLDWYAYLSTVRAKRHSYVKFIQGGATYAIPVRHPSGPKRVVEYAYFGEHRMDHAFRMVVGPGRDIERHRDALLELAATIRYKLVGDPDECVLSDPDAEDPLRVDHETIKKILSLSRPEEIKN